MGTSQTDRHKAIQYLLLLLNESENIAWIEGCMIPAGQPNHGDRSALNSGINVSRQPDREIPRSLTRILTKMGSATPEAILALIKMATTGSYNDYTRPLAIMTLAQIGFGDEKAIQALTKLVSCRENEYLSVLAAEALWQVSSESKNKSKAIDTLINLVSKSRGSDYGINALQALEEIVTNNPEIIKKKLRKNRKVWNLWQDRQRQLEEIDRQENDFEKENISVPKYKREIDTEQLEYLISGLRNNWSSWGENLLFKMRLGEIDRSDLLALLVSNLQDCLTEEILQTNLSLYEECFEIFWYCAQRLSYPEFYQAWQQPTAKRKKNYFNSTLAK